MRNYFCQCGAQVYFENSRCVACNSELGWCPSCVGIRALNPTGDGLYTCSNSSCGRQLKKCINYSVEDICNRCVLADDSGPSGNGLCDCCRFNDTIPDLSVEGNRKKWQDIENAKRRVMYTLSLLGLPYGTAKDGCPVPLSFDFKGDSLPKRILWFNSGKGEQVYTGHANGKVTINIREADDVEREKTRVAFGEAHRTVIGHFRHEMGHYFWDLLVKNQCEQESINVFGDHNNPDYGAALEIYYENGAKPNWKQTYISGYASMHPWEDFAESFAAYLDMVSIVDIALHADALVGVDPVTADFEEIRQKYSKLGLLLNEMNRAMGLLDRVPVVFTGAIVRKLEFVHDLLRRSRAR